jgi:hypothetical protein
MNATNYDKTPFKIGIALEGASLLGFGILWIFWAIFAKGERKQGDRHRRLIICFCFVIISLFLLLFHITLTIGKEGISTISGKTINWFRWSTNVIVTSVFMAVVLLACFPMASLRWKLSTIFVTVANIILLFGAASDSDSQWAFFAIACAIYVVILIIILIWSEKVPVVAVIFAVLQIAAVLILWLVGFAKFNTSINVESWVGLGVDVLLLVQGILLLFFWYKTLEPSEDYVAMENRKRLSGGKTTTHFPVNRNADRV